MKKKIWPILLIAVLVIFGACKSDVPEDTGTTETTAADTVGEGERKTSDEDTSGEVPGTDPGTVTDDPDTECVHDYEITVVHPSCEDAGYTQKTCRKCGYTVTTDAVAAAGHQYEAMKTVEPTCTEGGYKVGKCKVCGKESTYDKTKALGHKYGEAKTVKEPTCTKAGTAECVCERCGKTNTETVKALGHKYGDWVITTPATCLKEGEKTAACERCGKTKTAEIEKTEHDYCETRDCMHPNLCSICGDREDGSYPIWHDIEGVEAEIIDNGDGSRIERYICRLCGENVDYYAGYTSPEKYTNTSIMRAAQYLCYDVKGQIEDGNLFKVYGQSHFVWKYHDTKTSKYDFNGASGYEGTEKTSAGLPDVAKFRKRGLVCASFTSYYLFNYLPNVEGFDTAKLQTYFEGSHLRGVSTWSRGLSYAAKAGLCTKVGTSMNSTTRSRMTPGDIIIFKNDESKNSHIAVYVGTVDGEDFVFHCGGLRGTELTTLSQIADPYGDGVWPGSTVKEIYHINGIAEHDASYTKSSIYD